LGVKSIRDQVLSRADSPRKKKKKKNIGRGVVFLRGTQQKGKYRKKKNR